jgi:SAM-dependent methyltransferase
LIDTRSKEAIRREFFARIPKARSINPYFQSSFEFMWRAKAKARPGTRVLNIYSAADLSGERGHVYKDAFFNECELVEQDFWEDRFKYENVTEATRHKLPYADDYFDLVVTTKIIMEHVSEPADVMKEIWRVLKPGGSAFIIAPHIRRQHQKPYDYFRFTEFGLEYLARKAGFSSWTIDAADGYFYTIAMHNYFLERSIPMPGFLEKFFDVIDHWIHQPLYFLLHKLDNGYGRDFGCYFLLEAKK